MKTLAYLATIYLPMTATAVSLAIQMERFAQGKLTKSQQSLYSMTVLPKSASFSSFFVVLVVLLLFTISLGLKMSPVLNTTLSLLRKLKPQRSPAAYQRFRLKLPKWLSDYIQGYILLLEDPESYSFKLPDLPRSCADFLDLLLILVFGFFVLIWDLIRPIRLLRDFLIPEILHPRDQWVLFQYRHNRYLNIQWHPICFVLDIFRFAFIPVWVATAIALLCVLVVEDLLAFMFVSAAKLICCSCLSH